MLKQLNILLQKLTGFKLEYHGKYVKQNTCADLGYHGTAGVGTHLLAKAYTRATDPCQDSSYLLGKYS